jgi:hypothetical protein
MASYKFPEPAATGPKVADLEDKLVAVLPTDVGMRETKYGDKLVATARVVEIETDGTIIELGETRFAQEVLAEVLQAAHGTGEWIVGRIVKPNRAWLFAAPKRDEHELIATAMAKLGGDKPSDDLFGLGEGI